MYVHIKVAAAVAGLALAGLFGTKGNGTLKEETRQVGPFSGVEVSQRIQARVTVGAQISVKVEADENLLPLIKTEVVDGILVARIDGRGVSPSRAIALTVVTPTLSSAAASGGATVTAEATPGPTFEARASGASHVTVKGVSADQVKVNTSGAGDVHLSGSGKHVAAELSGASTLEAQSLSTESLEVKASGASQVTAQASAGLTAQLSGASHVRVHGSPQQREVSASGASSVSYEK